MDNRGGHGAESCAGANNEVEGESRSWSCGLLGKRSLTDFYYVGGVLIHYHVHIVRLRGAWHTLTSLVCRKHFPF